MRLSEGNQVIPITLPDINGAILNTNNWIGKPYMISFFRFASCPFCNLRMHQLVKRYQEFGEDFKIAAIFDSPLDNLKKHAQGHNAPFPVLADPENIYYEKYGIERSVSGVVKGMIFRAPSLIRGLSRGYIPTSLKGNLLTMPADFLIDSNGSIVTAYYGNDEGDHLPIEEIIEFTSR